MCRADEHSDIEFWLFSEAGELCGRFGNWLTPSMLAEAELPPTLLASLDVTTPTAAWQVGPALWARLGCPVPERLFAELDAALS